MKWIQKYGMFNESKTYKSKSIILDLCTSMCLINPTFLDNILDRGLDARYTENSNVFLNDLRNLVFNKNKLKFGTFKGGRAVEDTDNGKLNTFFNNTVNNFDIKKDWNALNKSRNVARNIQDKLLPEYRLEPEQIKYIYWFGPNKDKDNKQDIVVELNDDKQYSLVVNSNVSLNKTQSFNTLGDNLLGDNFSDVLYSDIYLEKWNKLAQEWLRLNYEYSKNEMKLNIEKFIDPDRIYTITWFDFFNIKHGDPRYKHLGEHFKEFDKNILNLSDLLNEMFKTPSLYDDHETFKKEWSEVKITVLNSRILEHLFSHFLNKGIEKENGLYKASDVVKQKIMHTVCEILNCNIDNDIYYFGVDNYNMIPSRQYFIDNINNIDIYYDTHVDLVVKDDTNNSDINDSQMKIKILLDGKEYIKTRIYTTFTGGELTSKLSSKIKVEI